MEQFRLVVEGNWGWRGRRTAQVRNPWDGSTVAEVPEVSMREAAHALDWAADRAQECEAWPFEARIAAIRAWAAAMSANRDRIAELETAEMGKPIRQTREVVDGVIRRLEQFAGAASVLQDRVLPTAARRATSGTFAFSIREPLGLVAGILPFNSPVSALVWKVAPAVLMGNACVIKPSSAAPASVLAAVDLLAEAGLPASALQVFVGRGARLGRLLADHSGVRRISFTGGTRAGTDIWKRGAATMKRLTLECGSNDPALVLSDADVDLAARAVVDFGIRRYSGQLCTAPKRVIVDDAIRGPFLEALGRELEGIVQGDPMDVRTELGPLVNEVAARTVEAQVEVGLAHGAALLCGGRRTAPAFMPPTVLLDVTTDNPMCRVVPLGRVLAVIAATSDNDAVRIANDSDYGIRAAIFSRDPMRAVRLARRLDTGGVAINGPASVSADPHLTVEPRKRSGIGSEGIFASLAEFSQSKFVWVNDWWSGDPA